MSISSQSFIENGYALTSKSKDGELVAKFAQTFGVKSVRGSSNRGGREALVQLLRVTRKGGRVAFAVDGPKGPRGEVKPGIIYLSQKLQVPILPFQPFLITIGSFLKLGIRQEYPNIFKGNRQICEALRCAKGCKYRRGSETPWSITKDARIIVLLIDVYS